MSEIVNNKFEHTRKKKNFYKNFKSKNQVQSNLDRDYENLEKVAQKYENQIRTHISLEQ
jgi:hypothetical protein